MSDYVTVVAPPDVPKTGTEYTYPINDSSILDVNPRYTSEDTPIDTPLISSLISSMSSYDEFMELFKKNRVSPDITNVAGNPLILYAAKSRNHDIVNTLIDYGCNVSQANSYGVTAMHIAIENNDLELVRILLSSGFNADQSDRENITPLMVAAENGRLEICQLLLENFAKVNMQTTTYHVTAVSLATEHNYIDVVKLLVKYGADVELPRNNGMTPLHFAAWYGHKETARYLIDHLVSQNKSINEMAVNKMTPFATAILENHTEIIDMFIEHISKFNIASNLPITCAFRSGNYELVKMLISSGYSLNSKSGDHLLINAVKEQSIEKITFLLENGADFNEEDEQGLTALDYVFILKNEEIINIFEPYIEAADTY